MVNKMKKTIGVIGLWHLGCVLCASWSKLGNKVVGFDYESSRIDGLNRGKPPIYEPELDEVIQGGMKRGNLAFSRDLKSLDACDFVFLSYDTPVGDDDGRTLQACQVKGLARGQASDRVLRDFVGNRGGWYVFVAIMNKV